MFFRLLVVACCALACQTQPRRECVESTTQLCLAHNCGGTQTCQADGTWGACQCDGLQGTGGGSTTTDSGLGGGGVAAGGGATATGGGAATGGGGSALGGGFATGGGADSGMPPSGDTCATSEELVVRNNIGSVEASTVNYRNDDTSWCGGNLGADRFFRFTLLSGAETTISVTTSTAGFQPLLSLRETCQGPVIACGVNAGSRADLMGYLPAGTYEVAVDGLTAASGDFLLSITTTPASSMPSTCLFPEPLVFHDNQAWAAGVLGFTSQSQICSPSTGGEHSFQLTVPQAGHLIVSTGDTLDFRSLSTRISSQRCGSSAPGVSQCGFASESSVHYENLLPVDAGTWYVTVDSEYSTAHVMDYSLSVQLETPAPNPSCEHAAALPLNGTVVGSTRGGRYSTQHCGTGRQLFYDLTLPTVSDVSLALKAPGTCVMSVIVNGCESDAGVAQACQAPNRSFSYTKLPAGTHTVIIESGDLRQTVTDFALDVHVDAGSGAATCASPWPLNGSGVSTFTGNTEYFSNNLVGRAGTDCMYTTGPEMVFSFTTTQTHNFAASLSNVTGLNPRLSLRTNCGVASASDSCGYTSLGITNLAAGTYYLVVDGSGDTHGPFTLTTILN